MPVNRRHFLLGASALLMSSCAAQDEATVTSDPTNPSPTEPTAAPASTDTTVASASPTTHASTADGSSIGAPASFVDRGTATGSQIALTFHTDGDLSMAHRIFDILDESSVVATCFLVGSWLEANPTIAERITGGGHEPANHTYSHPTLGDLGADAIATEITRCRDVLESVLGTGGQYFRPSGTADGTALPSDAVLREAGRAGYPTVVGFDVDPLDYQDPGADAVTSATLGGIGPGAIVSLHFGHQGTIDALPAIIQGLASRGLVPVPLSQLLM